MKVKSNFLDNILPSFGNPRHAMPTYNSGQRMFISQSYTSAAGHVYYKGIRFSERLVMVEKIGLYHTWEYIDGIELYSFNENKPELIASAKFDKVFYSSEVIRSKAEAMLLDYFNSQVLISEGKTDKSYYEMTVNKLIEEIYNNQLETFKTLQGGVIKLLNA